MEELLRFIERIIIVFFSGISIILGWHLFKIGIVSPQSGVVSGYGFRFVLQKAGPGVFFSLFGCIVMSIALVNGLEKEEMVEENNGKGDIKRSKYYYFGTAQKKDIDQYRLAINTLGFIDINNSSPYKMHRDAIRKSIEILNIYRDRIALQKYDLKEIRFYQECLESDDGKCRETKKFKEMHLWFSETFL